MKLTHQQIDDFNREGWLFLPELFSPEERATIEAAITKAERKTSGEIIVVAATASAGYFAYALMWAALLALLVPWPLIYLTNWPVEHIYLAQLAVFVIGAALVWSIRNSAQPRPLHPRWGPYAAR